MTDAKRIWLFRLALPIASVAAAMLWGATLKNALVALPITGVLFLFLLVMPSPLAAFAGIIVALFGLYTDDSESFLKDPDNAFFLLLGIPATLLTVSIVATRLN